jgi:hypothetical protein
MKKMEEIVGTEELVHVTSVEVIGDHQLRLSFSDGLVREMDFSEHRWDGVFEPLRDPTYFARVRVDPVCRTIVWNDQVDMDPEVLHGDHEPEFAAGKLIREFRQPVR